MKTEEFAERLWEFAARVGKAVDAMPETRLGRHVANQLLQSGTASAPIYEEACEAESREDAAPKLSAAIQAMRETLGWLRFAVRSALLPAIKLHELIDESGQLLEMLSRSDLASKQPTEPSQSGGGNPHSPISKVPGLKGLDHLAIAVPNTEEALKAWRDQLGFRVLYSEEVNEGTVCLTHLDLGNTQLQLVEPLTPEHPLQAWLRDHGPGLHHFCLLVENVNAAMTASPTPTASAMHQGTRGKRALFLNKESTQGVQVELTGG